jgi:hypothetical protein
MLVLKEIEKAEKKFPYWPVDIIHAASVVAEESGELTKASLQYTYEDGPNTACLKEAVQTACTSMRFISAFLNGDYSARLSVMR